MIRAWHFSLYTAVVSCPYPETKEPILIEKDSFLQVDEVKGIRIDFPHHSLPNDFEASVKVFYADDPMYEEPLDLNSKDCKALATPIIMLGPHGVTFDKDINIQLPLPDCNEIMKKFNLDPNTSLTVYHSPTGEGDPVTWEPCSVQYKIAQDDLGNYTISFPVRHFSWYKAVWDILASTMHGAKVGVSYFYPYIRFSMMCMAMMDETADTRSFGLEVRTRAICT